MNELFRARGYNEDEIKLTQLFTPAFYEQRGKALLGSTRFVHYTSASAAAQMIKSGSIWLRNAKTMNDYNEINFGIESVVACLGKSKKTDTAVRFWQLIDELGTTLSDCIINTYDAMIDGLRLDTYLFSLSEHKDEEDVIGRLSMWRAYGGSSGVGIVINADAIHCASDALQTFSFPVIYSDVHAAKTHFDELISGLLQNKEYLATIPHNVIADSVSTMLVSYSLCFKHPGFLEEQEWRVIHQPKLHASPRVTKKSVDIKGYPQIVYELPLKDVPDEGLVGLEPNALIDRIIIGPTQYPLALYDYFCSALEGLGVSRPSERVFVSNIPLRT